MVTWSSEETRVRKYGYKSPCHTPYTSKSNSWVWKSEYVSSFRGKPIYVTVGSKRRKAFHAFRRYKMEWNGSLRSAFCPTDGGSYTPRWAEDSPAKDLAMRLSGDSRWTGKLPVCYEPQLDSYGSELREFVVRDMFIKVNSPRWNAAVFLAELDETLVGIHKLLQNSLRSLWKTKEARKHLKHIAMNPHELWLWVRYMLIPTMLDVEELIQALQTNEVIDRVQDGSRSEPNLVETGEVTLTGYTNDNTMPLPWKSEVKYGVGGAIDIAMRHDPSPWGTSSWDVLMGTWERIPFSFIVDWFINVGDWLASLRSLEVVYVQSYATFAIETTTKLEEGPFNTYVDGNPICKCFLMDRIVDLEPPTLPLVDRRWRNVTRTIDLIALSIGMLKGILRRK